MVERCIRQGDLLGSLHLRYISKKCILFIAKFKRSHYIFAKHDPQITNPLSFQFHIYVYTNFNINMDEIRKERRQRGLSNGKWRGKIICFTDDVVLMKMICKGFDVKYIQHNR